MSLNDVVYHVTIAISDACQCQRSQECTSYWTVIDMYIVLEQKTLKRELELANCREPRLL